MNFNNKTDEQLMDLAKKRVKLKADLKSHIMSYFFTNAILVAVWFFTDFISIGGGAMWFTDFWPIWPIAIWGIYLVWDIVDVKMKLSGKLGDAVEREFENLKKGD